LKRDAQCLTRLRIGFALRGAIGDRSHKIFYFGLEWFFLFDTNLFSTDFAAEECCREAALSVDLK